LQDNRFVPKHAKLDFGADLLREWGRIAHQLIEQPCVVDKIKNEDYFPSAVTQEDVPNLNRSEDELFAGLVWGGHI
jgi:hypothetical protein